MVGGGVSEGWKGPRRMLLFAGSVEDATPREPGQSEWEAGCSMVIVGAAVLAATRRALGWK